MDPQRTAWQRLCNNTCYEIFSSIRFSGYRQVDEIDQVDSGLKIALATHLSKALEQILHTLITDANARVLDAEVQRVEACILDRAAAG